jgi:hypothetical protein
MKINCEKIDKNEVKEHITDLGFVKNKFVIWFDNYDLQTAKLIDLRIEEISEIMRLEYCQFFSVSI